MLVRPMLRTSPCAVLRATATSRIWLARSNATRRRHISGLVTNFEEQQQRAAEPLNLNVYNQLTPTLRKFTLPDKIAVVTGYASFKR